MVKNVNITDHVGRCYSNDDGAVIQSLLKKHLKQDQKVVLSFKGIDGVTSSFVNTALIELLNDFDFDFIRNHLSFNDSKRQINNMIRDRFNFEEKKRKYLVSC